MSMPDPHRLMAIHHLLAVYGHVVDDWQLHRLGDLYAEDGVFDMSAMGTPAVQGIGAIRRLLESLREKRLAVAGPTPLAHLTTNIVVTDDPDGTVRVASKTLLVFAGEPQRVLTGLYEDIVAEGRAGWRILRRTALRPMAIR